MERPTVVALLGLGEAGSAIGADLVAAGATVRGFDPKVTSRPGIQACDSDRSAAANADVVLSVNSAHDALEALREGKIDLRSGAVWADLNTGSAALKRALAAECEGSNALFVDVALMSPVPGRGLQTPMLACGPGASRYDELMSALGAQVTVLDGAPGTAATRKLLRSVFFKGLAAAVVESLAAARAAGCEDWIRANIADELTRANEATVDRLVSGSSKHAVRRGHEMSAATALLDELGVPPRIARASRDWLAQLENEPTGAIGLADPARPAARM